MMPAVIARPQKRTEQWNMASSASESATHETVAAMDAGRTHQPAGAPLRVLHIFRYFRPDFTGEGLYLEKLAPLLDDLNIQADVAVECTRSPAMNRPPAGIGRTSFFGLGTGRVRRVPAVMTGWFLVNAFRYDVVHFHAFVDRIFLFHLIARLSGCRIVQSATLDDGLGSVLRGYRPIYRPLLLRLFRLIDAAVAISPRLQADTRQVLPPRRTWLIPQGVNPAPDTSPADRSRWRAHWGFAADDIVLLFVGGMCARKDVTFLVENHAALRPPASGRVKLLLVGPQLEDGYLDALRRLIAASPCHADIVLEGYMDDPSPAYGAADVFVFASRGEGFGNVLIEAMSWGLPVVSRRLEQVTDQIIDDGRTGFLFDTTAEYHAAATRLIADPSRRLVMGRAACQTVRQRFDLPGIAHQYARLYRLLTGKPDA